MVLINDDDDDGKAQDLGSPGVHITPYFFLSLKRDVCSLQETPFFLCSLSLVFHILSYEEP